MGIKLSTAAGIRSLEFSDSRKYRKGIIIMKKIAGICAAAALLGTLAAPVTAFAEVVAEPTNGWINIQTGNGVGWKYISEDEGTYANCWKWIDANKDGIAECYHFNSDGTLSLSTVVDGRTVNHNGAWIIEDDVQQAVASDIVSNIPYGSKNYGWSMRREDGTWYYHLPDGSTVNFGYNRDSDGDGLIECTVPEINALFGQGLVYFSPTTGQIRYTSSKY